MENDDGYSDGNGTCRIEGCLKNICCRTGGGSNGMCRQGGAMCRAEHCTPAPAEPGVSVQVNPGVWMCKSWNPEMQKTLDNIVESIKNINYKDFLSNIKRLNI